MPENVLPYTEQQAQRYWPIVGNIVLGVALGLIAKSENLSWPYFFLQAYIFGVILNIYLLFRIAKWAGGGFNRYLSAISGGFLPGCLDGVRIAVIGLLVRWIALRF